MIDINTYRGRIGLFSPKIHENKFLLRRDYYKQASWNENKSGEITLSVMVFVFKMFLLLGLLQHNSLDIKSESSGHGVSMNSLAGWRLGQVCGVVCSTILWAGAGQGIIGNSGGVVLGYHGTREENFKIKTEIADQNFEARYKNGNIQKMKGILNMHLNIRSLKYKVSEVKNIIKQHSP